MQKKKEKTWIAIGLVASIVVLLILTVFLVSKINNQNEMMPLAVLFSMVAIILFFIPGFSLFLIRKRLKSEFLKFNIAKLIMTITLVLISLAVGAYVMLRLIIGHGNSGKLFTLFCLILLLPSFILIWLSEIIFKSMMGLSFPIILIILLPLQTYYFYLISCSIYWLFKKIKKMLNKG